MRALPDAGGLTLRATVTDVATGRRAAAIDLHRDSDDVHTGEIAPLAAGDYRLPRRGRRGLRGPRRPRALAGVRRRRRTPDVDPGVY